ncbi:hypothetical protein L226DRAFT_256606 [Lentinus tigrinus ALCF2SS1-7]|uniref:uncharacterized protein n=1 Tax=Lentinus tigrinus ALCF2SS1-7 TaxID=1328758 RepID=UPI00116639EF|nr:hypothetical protein L226DRAFT_256606 [Lentinus tigrinus ALCF2SS1-7]
MMLLTWLYHLTIASSSAKAPIYLLCQSSIRWLISCDFIFGIAVFVDAILTVTLVRVLRKSRARVKPWSVGCSLTSLRGREGHYTIVDVLIAYSINAG